MLVVCSCMKKWLSKKNQNRKKITVFINVFRDKGCGFRLAGRKTGDEKEKEKNNTVHSCLIVQEKEKEKERVERLKRERKLF